ncbi:hypothetical protein BT96DRAFT_996817 [Gymnopus androsaceus JB14]|uniref:DUF6532 domain-containing protein n=1 Tax=Gymnopus androsaceus JB14 TaxID=1447944 RepID=A0A6A4HDA5_9AGAR|nr:hypothetical protein BT96DRAFT_996817 [Gymnopus androsaceus JB14]
MSGTKRSSSEKVQEAKKHKPVDPQSTSTSATKNGTSVTKKPNAAAASSSRTMRSGGAAQAPPPAARATAKSKSKPTPIPTPKRKTSTSKCTATNEFNAAYIHGAAPADSSRRKVHVIYQTQLKLITSRVIAPKKVILPSSDFNAGLEPVDLETKHSQKLTQDHSEVPLAESKKPKEDRSKVSLSGEDLDEDNDEDIDEEEEEEEDDELEAESTELMAEPKGEQDNMVVEDITSTSKQKKQKKQKRSCKNRNKLKVLLLDFEDIDGSEALLTLGKLVYWKGACLQDMFPASDTVHYLEWKSIVDDLSQKDPRKTALQIIGLEIPLRQRAVKYANYATSNVRREFGHHARTLVCSTFNLAGDDCSTTKIATFVAGLLHDRMFHYATFDLETLEFEKTMPFLSTLIPRILHTALVIQATKADALILAELKQQCHVPLKLIALIVTLIEHVLCEYSSGYSRTAQFLEKNDRAKYYVLSFLSIYLTLKILSYQSICATLMDLKKKSPRYSDRLQRGTYKAMMYVFLCFLYLSMNTFTQWHIGGLISVHCPKQEYDWEALKEYAFKLDKASEAGEQEYSDSESDDEKDVGKGIERDGKRNGEMDGERDGERESESGGESSGKKGDKKDSETSVADDDHSNNSTGAKISASEDTPNT